MAHSELSVATTTMLLLRQMLKGRLHCSTGNALHSACVRKSDDLSTRSGSAAACRWIPKSADLAHLLADAPRCRCSSGSRRAGRSSGALSAGNQNRMSCRVEPIIPPGCSSADQRCAVIIVNQSAAPPAPIVEHQRNALHVDQRDRGVEQALVFCEVPVRRPWLAADAEAVDLFVAISVLPSAIDELRVNIALTLLSVTAAVSSRLVEPCAVSRRRIRAARSQTVARIRVMTDPRLSRQR